MSKLLIMAKRPELGKAKTRLAAGIGAEKALEVYKTLLNHTLETGTKGEWNTVVFLTGDGEVNIPESFTIAEQVNGDLGTKMEAAFRHHEQPESKVMIGTD